MKTRNSKLLAACCAAWLVIALRATALGQQLPDGWFEFPMSGLDASLPDIDIATLPHAPAGQGGFIRSLDGHFADESGTRIRFLGTNLCFGAAFPDKSHAEPMAVRLRKLGINVIRFHHIDNAAAPRGIWRTDRLGFDPDQLDRLDWLIAKLAEQGIYTNLNLHVSRNYPGISDELPRSFRYGKAVDNFYQPYIELQQDYARQLLTHRNPYRERTYADDPAVLCIEINNENSLTTAEWDDLVALRDPWGDDLRRRWNEWLADRYETMEQLRSAWQEVDQPPGDELLINGDPVDRAPPWQLEAPRPARATLVFVPAGPQPGQSSLRAELTEPGSEPWHFQVNQSNLSLQRDRVYTFRFWARSEPPRTIRADARLARAPWTHLGLDRQLELSGQWQQFTLPFRASDGEAGRCRVGWVLGNVRGAVWLAGVSLKPGGVLGTPHDQSLAAQNIALTRDHDTAPRRADYQRFLMETEQQYHAEMVRFLKHDLGLRSLVTNTQASYGGTAGVLREARLSDFVDMHGYWQHPQFPGRPWDPVNWQIANTSMINERDGGVLERIALHRVEGKPFTVSEYNHPTPNDHCAEMFPLLASQAAFQDWDGIYQFSYAHSSEHLDRPLIQSYFDLVNHPGQLVWLPIAATIFRTAALQAGTAPVVLRLPAESDADPRLPVTDVWSVAGAPPAVAVVRRVGVRVEGHTTAVLSEPVSIAADELVSSTGQIRWRWGQQGDGRYLVDAPQVRCAVGFLQGGEIELGDVSFAVTQANSGWASMGLAALDGEPIARSKKMLLVAVGRVGNSGMQWNPQRTSVGKEWGHEPTIAEGIGATVQLPGRVTVQALDSGGAATETVPVQSADGSSRVEIGSRFRTLWYLVTRPS
jgi:hypothetical protein